MQSFTQYKIQQLRMTSQQKLLEGILALLAAIFITALLPSLLLQYLYADQMLTEAPPLLQYLPLVTFAAGLLYLLYVIVGNMMRSKEITRLEREMMMTTDASMDMSTSDAELEELEALVDEALAAQKPKTSSKKSTSKRKSSKR